MLRSDIHVVLLFFSATYDCISQLETDTLDAASGADDDHVAAAVVSQETRDLMQSLVRMVRHTII